MTPLYVALLACSLAVVAVSHFDHRTIAWLGAAQASFWISVLYWDLGLPYGEGFGAVTNITVIGLLCRYALYRWELWVCAIFVTMIGVDLLYNFGKVFPMVRIEDRTFSIALFLLNALLVLTVGLVGAFRIYGSEFGGSMRPWRTIFGRVRHVYRAGPQN